MTKVRVTLLASLAGCMLLVAGCKSLAGSACLKSPSDAEVGDKPLLRIPVGLDPIDTSSTLKVPALDSSAAATPPVVSRCLEDPPMIQKLPDPVAAEKSEKQQKKMSSRDARDARPPGPRFTN